MLENETTRQQNNERLRVQFAQMANRVGQWIQQRQSRMIDIGMNAVGTLENQLQELKSLNDEINNFKADVLELDDLNRVFYILFLYTNLHNKYLDQVIHNFFIKVVRV